MQDNIKMEVKMCLRLSKYHAAKPYSLIYEAPHHEDVLQEWRYGSTHLKSALDGSTWSAPRPGRFIPGKHPGN